MSSRPLRCGITWDTKYRNAAAATPRKEPPASTKSFLHMYTPPISIPGLSTVVS